MEIIWLDGDIMESWDDLIEHLEFLGEVERLHPLRDHYYRYKDVAYHHDDLIEVLKPLIELNSQLYKAWALLYKVKRGEDAMDEIRRYLDNPAGSEEETK